MFFIRNIHDFRENIDKQHSPTSKNAIINPFNNKKQYRFRLADSVQKQTNRKQNPR